MAHEWHGVSNLVGNSALNAGTKSSPPLWVYTRFQLMHGRSRPVFGTFSISPSRPFAPAACPAGTSYRWQPISSKFSSRPGGADAGWCLSARNIVFCRSRLTLSSRRSRYHLFEALAQPASRSALFFQHFRASSAWRSVQPAEQASSRWRLKDPARSGRATSSMARKPTSRWRQLRFSPSQSRGDRNDVQTSLDTPRSGDFGRVIAIGADVGASSRVQSSSFQRFTVFGDASRRRSRAGSQLLADEQFRRVRHHKAVNSWLYPAPLFTRPCFAAGVVAWGA